MKKILFFLSMMACVLSAHSVTLTLNDIQTHIGGEEKVSITLTSEYSVSGFLVKIQLPSVVDFDEDYEVENVYNPKNHSVKVYFDWDESTRTLSISVSNISGPYAFWPSMNNKEVLQFQIKGVSAGTGNIKITEAYILNPDDGKITIPESSSTVQVNPSVALSLNTVQLCVGDEENVYVTLNSDCDVCNFVVHIQLPDIVDFDEEYGVENLYVSSQYVQISNEWDESAHILTITSTNQGGNSIVWPSLNECKVLQFKVKGVSVGTDVMRIKDSFIYSSDNTKFTIPESGSMVQVSSAIKKGDVTGDGKVDVEDVNAAINIILEQKTASDYSGVSDLTGDGKVDVEDVNLIINYILNPETGPVGPEGAVVIEVNGVKFKMVNVKGGTFTMGATSEQGGDASDSEKPAHQVTLSSYSIGATEVTQELWQAVMGSNPSRFSSANGYTENLQRPVEMVSFEDCCYRFITKLNQLTGRTFRLPTEAEWEYAARGGNKSMGYKYAGSNTVNDVCWYWDDLPSQTSLTAGYGTQPVGRKAPNELGLYDMSGNVWEWTLDNNVDYPSVPETDPNHQAGGMPWVYRGGGWASYASSCRVSKRDWANATKAFNFVGMRLVSIPTPVISVTSNSLDFEGVTGQTYTKEIIVSGHYLRDPIKVNLNTGSSTVFFVSTTSISESAAQNGAKLTVTFRSSFAGDYRGTITLSSPNAADVVIPLHGHAVE